MNWLDIGVIIILAIATLKGVVKGLVISVFQTVGWIVAGFLALKFHSVLAGFLMLNTNLYSKILELIGNKTETVANMDATNMDSFNTDILQFVKLPKGLEEFFLNNDTIQEYEHASLNSIGNTFGEVLAKLFIDIISIILIFIAIKIILSIIEVFLDKLVSIPILKQINSLSGGAFGFIKGMIVVFVILAVLIPIINLTNSEYILTELDKSLIANYLYNNNLLIEIIKEYIQK